MRVRLGGRPSVQVPASPSAQRGGGVARGNGRDGGFSRYRPRRRVVRCWRLPLQPAGPCGRCLGLAAQHVGPRARCSSGSVCAVFQWSAGSREALEFNDGVEEGVRVEVVGDEGTDLAREHDGQQEAHLPGDLHQDDRDRQVQPRDAADCHRKAGWPLRDRREGATAHPISSRLHDRHMARREGHACAIWGARGRATCEAPRRPGRRPRSTPPRRVQQAAEPQMAVTCHGRYTTFHDRYLARTAGGGPIS